MNPMPPPPALIGRTLGGFLIQSLLGSGGMGVVYRAHDARLKRTVAIKVLHPKAVADGAVRERFVREGRTAALIDHPNVVRVLAAGEEDGIPYLVMEHIEGGSLDKVLESPGGLSLARCLRIGKQLAEALSSAHRVGVMHRDVKPANVLFTTAGEPKLADFGLARDEAGSKDLSQTGILLGTPHYMSPEACEGQRGDARSDIYSLGVLLYAMLEKRLPFTGDSQAQILISQIKDPVPPLTQAPPSLRRIICRALEKNPADRWESAADFAAALERALEDVYLPGQQPAPGGKLPSAASTYRLPAPSPTPEVPGFDTGAGRLRGLAATILSEIPRNRRALTLIASVAVVLVAATIFVRSRRGGTAGHGRDAASAPASPIVTPIMSLGPESTPPVPPTPTMFPPDPVLPQVVFPAPVVRKPTPDPPVREEQKTGWSPASGLQGLRDGFVRHDPAGLEADVAAAGTGESEIDHARIESARHAVRRLASLLDSAFATFLLQRGQVIDVRLADGSSVHGILQAVDEPARKIYIQGSSILVNLSAAQLASGELATRALEPNPSDDALLGALDLLLLAGNPQESWPVALRARRRGLAIEPDREALLAAEVSTEAETGLREIESLRLEPDRLRSASRDWLRKYRSLPRDHSRAREALCRGGGLANAGDLALYCAGSVTGNAPSFAIEYGSPEALLADFERSGDLLVEPGTAASLRPAAGPVVLRLKGLSWKEGVIELQLRTASPFGVLIGWRAPGEHFDCVLSPEAHGNISIALPLREANFDAAPAADGWIDARFAWASGKISVRINGVSRDCPLPRGWSGEIGFAPEGAWSWRSLRVYGQAEFTAGEAPGPPKALRVFKVSWGNWKRLVSNQNELSIVGGEALVWASPPRWEAGNDYRASFRMTVAAGATVAFDIGTGEGRRRILLGAKSASGFILGRDLVRSGPAPALPAARDLAVEIVVHRGVVRLALDGVVAWTGHLGASNQGGLAVGVSGGEVTFKNLELWELEP